MSNCRYNLPNTGIPFDKSGEEPGIESNYEIFESRRYGRSLRKALTMKENFSDWIEDDNTWIGEYKGLDPDLDGSYVEIDKKTETEPETRLYLPK